MSKHRRVFVVIREGVVHEASGYSAALVKLRSDRSRTALFNVLWWVLDLEIWDMLPWEAERSSPRYRVIVGRPGNNGTMGVVAARTKRKAVRAFDVVDRMLATKSHEDVKAELDLDL